MEEIYIPYWLVGLIILVAAIFCLWLFRFIKSKFKGNELYGMDKEQIKKRWQAIEDLSKDKSEMHYKMAVLEADKLLDHVLKAMAFGGSSLGERLKVACFKYPNLRRVWACHKIRNQLVHEANYRLKESEARKAITGFKSALKELRVL